MLVSDTLFEMTLKCINFRYVTMPDGIVSSMQLDQRLKLSVVKRLDDAAVVRTMSLM